MQSLNGELLLVLLAGVILFAGLARVFKVPYPILLVMAGVALSFVPHLPRVSLPPELVFTFFLPPLLYSAAWTLSWREFRRNFGVVSMLAFGLVIVTVLSLMAAAGRLLPGFTPQSALLLGAVIAATDAIAATSVARRVGLPHSIVSLLEAESLINDGTGLLALQFGVGILLTGHTPTLAEGAGRLALLTLGGVVVGLLVAVPIAWIERKIDDGPIEIVLSVLVSYVTYFAGERLHVSGVIGVIVCGMYMSRQSVSVMSAAVRLQATAVWDSLTFVLNGLIFMLLGLQLPFVLAQVRQTQVHSIWLYGAVFSLAVIALRMAWIFAERHAAHLLSRWLLHTTEERPDWRELLVVGWGGMRGVLSLAAAVSLPLATASGPFAQRSLIIFLSFYLIVVTLVVQGLSLPWLIRSLGICGASDLLEEELEARRTILTEAFAYLSRRRSEERHHRAMLDQLVRAYRFRLDSLPSHPEDHEDSAAAMQDRREAILAVIKVERDTLLRLRNSGEIDDTVLRRLQREMDLAESRVLAPVS